jgi:hypothetical protein
MKLVAVLAALALAACGAGPVVIDGSNEAAFADSVEAARRDLPVADRLAFDKALMAPPGKRFGARPGEAEALARTAYHGMTAVEVVELAGGGR